MKKWELNDDYEFECKNTIIFQNTESNCNILKLMKMNLLLLHAEINA